MFFHPIEQVNLCQIFLVAFCGLNCFVDASIQNIQVREDEFEVDNFDIAFWTDAALDMDNFSVLKAADNVNNRVYFADIGEEFISQTFTLGSALYKTRNIDKFDDGRSNLIGVVKICKFIQTMVGNRYGAEIRLDGAERVVCRLRACVGNCVKQGTFADIWQTNNT